MSSPVFVRRPIHVAVVALTTIPRVLTSLALILMAIRSDAFLVGRILLGALGLAMISACALLWLSSSGVLIDREARTVTPVYRLILGMSVNSTTVQVGEGDNRTCAWSIAGST